jgi:cholest-4-en-3-one 26-monooxygenase
MSAPAPLESLELLDPAEYARSGYPHAAWRRLRREAPLFFFGRADPPFWALTRHAQIVAVSRDPQRFRNWPRFQYVFGQPEEHGMDTNTLISMDPPRHRRYRTLASPRFTPRALRALEPEVERIAAEILADLAKSGRGECDFVDAFAAPLPIAVIARLLDVPRQDWALLYDWTNRLLGAADPEYRDQHGTAEQTRTRTTRELHAYFERLMRERRSSPGRDLVSLIARAELADRPISDADVLSYCLILVAAGNETTRNAISGGLLAFIEHPEQWQRLRREPRLVPTAVEEILRWTTPVVQMARTAAEDVELAGARIRKGELVVMFYASANRDEAVFENPDAFDPARQPNRHLSFGLGEHFCIGAHLARMELAVAFRLLAQRLEHIELAGPVERLYSSMVGGIKRLPLSFRSAS